MALDIQRRMERWRFELGDLGEALYTLIGQPRLALERLRSPQPRRPRLGLALSGGAERGIAHVGVLSVLEREGIVPDMVAGCSAGSAIGAIYCAGWSTQQMLQLVAGLNWRKLGRPRWNVLRSMGILDGSRLESYLVEMLGDLAFEDLKIPLSVMATDLITGEEVPISSGRLAPAVRASCSVPAVFTPVPYQGRLLVDGGVVNNMPTSELAGKVDYIIAVNASAVTEPLEPPSTLLDVMDLSFMILRRSACRAQPPADCLIVPKIGSTNTLHISANLNRLFQVGVDAAEAALPQLRKDLGLPDR